MDDFMYPKILLSLDDSSGSLHQNSYFEFLIKKYESKFNVKSKSSSPELNRTIMVIRLEFLLTDARFILEKKNSSKLKNDHDDRISNRK